MATAYQVEHLLAGVLDNNGDPLAGGKVYTYEAGTTTNKTMWVDANKAVAATNPIILDAQGRANVYGDGNYKLKYTTSTDVVVDTPDNLFYAIPSTTTTLSVVTKTADYTVTSTDDVVLVNAASGSVNIYLPASGTVTGREFTVVKIDSGTNTVTVDPNGSETINGSSTFVISSQYGAIRTFADGSNWVDPQLAAENVLIGTAAARASYAAPFEGLLWVENDTDDLYRYRTAAWILIATDLSTLGGVAKNILTNGCGRVWQSGTAFTAATTPANDDDTYLMDQAILLSDGNDIVDLDKETTTVPTGAYASMKVTVATANKKWGFLFPVEAQDSAVVIGGVASWGFKASKAAGNATMETLRAAIISWDGTADSITSDVVSAWAVAGTDPTLVANWTYESTPTNLTLTSSFQKFIEDNVSIDTAATKQVALFVWCDDTDATAGDICYLTEFQVEEGSAASDFEYQHYSQVLNQCQRYLPVISGEGVVGNPWASAAGGTQDATTSYPSILFQVQPRVRPTGITISSAAHFGVSSQTMVPVACTTLIFNSSNWKPGSTLLTAGVAAGLTAGSPSLLSIENASARMFFNGCRL